MRGFAGVGLHRPKDALNIGAALRATAAYDAAFLAIASDRVQRLKVRTSTDTCKTWRHKPIFRVDDLRSVIPFDCQSVAVDLIPGAEPLPTFEHPQRAFYIFGPEDGTLGHAVTDWCQHIVSIPTVHCMNLAATVNVVLYDRLAKSLAVGVA